MLTYRYLTRNKKRTLITISSIVLVTVLFLCIGLLFSSIREYLVDEVTQTKGSYHVELKGDIRENEHILKKVTKDNVNYITFDDIRKTYDYTDELCADKCTDIIYNEELLSLYGVSDNENVMNTLISLLIIILVVLSLGIVFIIYNAFAISVMERKKQFSLLKSVGMTKKKIRNMILLESLIILIIGLFIGFIISVNLMFLGLNFISDLLEPLFTRNLKLSFYPLFVIIPLVFVVFLVLFSAFIPAVRISKVSIAEGIANVNDFKYKKESKFMERFSITKRLAFLNYQRCKKKYRPIVLCVFISTIMYVTVSLYLNYGIKSINDFTDIPDYDASISILDSSLEEAEKLKNFGDEYDSYEIFNSCFVKADISDQSYLNGKFKQNLMVVNGNGEYVINKIKEVQIKDGRMEKIDEPYLKSEVKMKVLGKEIKVKTKNEGLDYLDSYLTKDNMILVTDHFNDYCSNFSTTLFLKGDLNLEKDLSLWAKNNQISEIEYIDIKKANKMTQNIILAIKIGLYGVLILVLLIEISSIINTIWGSMNLRSREFAILKSVGATNKQINLMLLSESFYIVFKGFIYALPLVVFINYILYQSLNEVLKVSLIIPYKELLLCLLVSLVVIYLTMLKAHKKFKKNNIISLINNDNI